MFITNKIIIDKETSELIMPWSLIKLETAIIIQIKLNDIILSTRYKAGAFFIKYLRTFSSSHS